MILVVGSTGLVGGMITRGLLEQDADVRILVRRGSDFGPLVDAGADPVLGDLKDPASLRAACAGIDVVVTTASAGERGGADDPQTVDLQGNRNLIDAARDAGVRQFIYVSALHASADSPLPLPRAKALTEAYLRASGVPYTILAANGIMDVTFRLVVEGPLSAGHPVCLVGEGTRRHAWVAARDVAAYAVAAVRHPDAWNRRIPIGGPDAVSWRDIIAAYERHRGQAIPVRSVPPGTPIPNLPPIYGLAEFLGGLLAFLETFDSPMDMAATSAAFAVTPTTLDDFVRTRVRLDAATTTPVS